jgi:hypothetical protein
MKFPQVPLGRRFVFQGESYTKTGPMTAGKDSDGSQRMIPRSALVLPADTANRRTASSSKESLGGAWPAALDAYEQELRQALGPLDGDLEERLERALAAARVAFEAAIR